MELKILGRKRTQPLPDKLLYPPIALFAPTLWSTPVAWNIYSVTLFPSKVIPHLPPGHQTHEYLATPLDAHLHPITALRGFLLPKLNYESPNYCDL